MPNPTPKTISVFVEQRLEPTTAYRGGTKRPISAPNLQDVDIGKLQTQVNIFLTQMNQVMQDTPESVRGFRLSEFEVSVGLVFQGEGEIKLALIANAKASAELNAGLKFVFKKP